MTDQHRTDEALIAITLNGAQRSVPGQMNIKALLLGEGVDPTMGGIAVAVDARVVPRSAWERTLVEAGAEIEVIRATAGG